MVNEIKERSNNQAIFPLGFSAERSWERIDYAQKESFPAGSSLFWRFFRFFKRTSMCCKFQIDFSAQSFTCFERTTCDLSLFPVPRFLNKLHVCSVLQHINDCFRPTSIVKSSVTAILASSKLHQYSSALFLLPLPSQR